ncbi:DELLA protein RGL1-like [Ziziphus jujuba]|uniref:DELLA protein RGL1-like n=1 Tax=Ziziphus jujuba TaxID=326968 RepID=A0A6P6GHR1_ZIZJJ|nr:DELLA protein RGL1-like [Ziziphus jujuba]
MDNGNLISFTPFDFNGFPGEYGPPEHYEEEEPAVLKGKQGLCPAGVQDFQNVNHLPLKFSFYQQVNNKTKNFEDDQHQEQQQQQQQQSKSDYMVFDDFDTLGPAAKPVSRQEISSHQLIVCSGPHRSSSTGTDIAESIRQMQIPSLSSMGLLSDYGNFGFKKLKGDQRLSNVSMSRSYMSRKKSSTEEIMRVAGARYIQFFNRYYYDDYHNMPMHPFGYALSGLSEEETRDVELAHLLLAAAEKVGYQQFVSASRLLLRREWISSSRANPVQRVVFCFAEALREMIERETGRGKINERMENKNMGESLRGLSTSIPFVKCYQAIPFPQVLTFAGIQTILENVESQTRIHFIDLEIRSGVQWTIVMEALAARVECRIECLKITAVGYTGTKKIEETGKRLVSVAESLNLPFSFKAVYVSNMDDIKEELFEIEDDDESLIIYSSLALRTMISRPRCLENLMRAITSVYPSMMVVIEIEANHNSPSFVNRFIEALFFYSAFFDCLENCVKEEECRKAIEGVLAEGIRDIVAKEGSERITRNVKMEVWRAFFARYKMVETKLSDAAMYQTSLVAKQFGCGSACNVERNGKCLIAGWKGTPINSLSVWKFR